jgi:DNA-binding transcriptional ArsR family regulator
MRQLAHPSLEQITLTRVLCALGDPVRLSILRTLADRREHQWGELNVEVGPSTLSHHVKVLREAGVITHRKVGTRCFVRLRVDLQRKYPGLLKLVLRCAGRDGVAA